MTIIYSSSMNSLQNITESCAFEMYNTSIKSLYIKVQCKNEKVAISTIETYYATVTLLLLQPSP